MYALQIDKLHLVQVQLNTAKIETQLQLGMLIVTF